MKLSDKTYWLAGAAIIFFSCLAYCKRTPQFDAWQNDSSQNKASAQQAAELPPNRKPVEPPKPAVGESQSAPKPDGFSGIELLPKLGAPLSASLMESLQKTWNYPELHKTALEPGGKVYVIGVNSGGGLVLHLDQDNALLAFGFTSNPDVTTSDEEQRLLSEFMLLGQPTVTVLDDKFEPAKMQIQTYQSKASPKAHALLYSKGRSRTLVFFDSTRVEMKRLLPTSPDTMDPAILKQLRSLVEPAK